MESTATESITVYSDYVCPFCYLGRKSLAAYQADRSEPLRIEWHPFDLRSGKRTADGHIDHTVADGKDDAYFEDAKQSVRRLQQQYDVEMATELATDVDSLNAQLAAYYVKQSFSYEEWLAFDEAVFEALWVEEQDIGDRSVLQAIASDVGIDPAEIDSALDDETLGDELTAQFQAAQHAGITGVPTFSYGDHVARGAVPPAHLERLVAGVE